MVQPDDLVKEGVLTNEDLNITDAPHVSSGVTVESAHVATPEVSHPGESQSNGLAEE